MHTAATLPELLRDAAREAPDAEAFRYRDERLTYRDWDALTDRLAAAFAARGVGHGSVVALLLPSTPLYQIAYLAAARLGAITTGINTRYRRTEIGHVLRCSGASLVLGVRASHDADFRTMIDELRPTLPELRETIWLDGGAVRDGTAAVVEALAAGNPPAPTRTVHPEDPVAIVFTSGTTGAPKGATYTHAALLAVAAIEARRHEGGVPPFLRHLSAGVAFAHVGLMARIGIQISCRGSSLIHDAFDPVAVMDAIERDRLPHLGGFPTQVIMLLEHPERRNRDLSSLRTVLLGGAPSTPELIRRIQDELGVTVSVRYASTEVGIATASGPGDPPELLATTVGKPTTGVDLRVVDEQNHSVPPDTIGEVVIRSPATMRGYWRNDEATAKIRDAEGWLHTGDLGFLDAAGYLHLRGRQSEMYIRGGFNVYPSEVEDVLARHPNVVRAAVVGLPEPTFGEVGWAYVQPRDAAHPPTLAEIRAYVGQELASFKRPDGLTILPELPVTPMFKVDKQVLRARGRD